jgi:hypothetical protein
VLDAAGDRDVVDKQRRVEDARSVRLLHRAVDHQAVRPIAVEREGIVAPHLARVERAVVDAELALVRPVRRLGDDADDADPAIRSVEQRVAAPEHFDALDHVRVDRRGAPDILQRRPAVIGRHAVEHDQRVAVPAAVQPDGVLTLVRRVADVDPLHEELHRLGEVGRAALDDVLGRHDLHRVAELDRLDGLRARGDFRAGDDDRVRLPHRLVAHDGHIIGPRSIRRALRLRHTCAQPSGKHHQRQP